HALDTSLPDMGDASGAYLDARLENKLGDAFMRYIRASSEVIDDPLLNSYLQSLGDKLARHSDARSRSFNFFLVKSPIINAFAGPGGNIGIHTGLLMESQTESELAAVLAHEIAHVSQRHLARLIQAADQMTLPAAGLLLAAVLLGASGAGSAAAAALIGGQAALVQKQINFTRANEREADNIGMKILSGSKFDPRAMGVFFQRMGRASTRSGAIAMPEFLQSHPVTSDRIADSLARAEKYPYRQAREDLRYHFTKATLRAEQFGSSRSAIRHFESTLRDGRYRNEDAERYGYVQALKRGKQYAKAQQELAKLLKKQPSHDFLLVTKARLALAQGNKNSAVTTMRSILKRKPGDYHMTLMTADIMLKARQPKSAYQLLKKFSRSHSDDPFVMRLLSRAAAGSGKKAESHSALAEYHYLRGEPDVAVQQLRIALKTPGLSFQQKSKIEARSREIDAEIRASKKKKKKDSSDKQF
ncbi:MAG: M48 family metalloprotease, partial [Pseudomonadota bacterium]